MTRFKRFFEALWNHSWHTTKLINHCLVTLNATFHQHFRWIHFPHKITSNRILFMKKRTKEKMRYKAIVNNVYTKIIFQKKKKNLQTL